MRKSKSGSIVGAFTKVPASSQARWHVAELASLPGGPSRLLCEAAKVKLKLQWRPRDVGHTGQSLSKDINMR